MDEIRQKIVVGANDMFLKYGIRSVTMDDMAKHLGISKKTIYQCFAEKDELVQAVNKLHQDKWEAECVEIIANTSNAIEELLQFSIIFRKAISTMNPSVMNDMFKYHRSAWEDWNRYKSETLKQRVAGTIIRGKNDGFFRKELNEEILAIMRIEQIDLGFNHQLFPLDKFNFEEVQIQFFDHFIYGCLTPKGVELYEKSKKQIIERELNPIVK